MKYITRTVFRNGREGTLTHNKYKEEKNLKKNNRGFTLAELLIVVAIIAVLVAIAIPVFTAQLEKSREATDLANVRSAYAELMANYLTWDGKSTIDDITVPAKQVQTNWQSDGNNPNTTISEGKTGGGVSVPASTTSYVVHIATTGNDAGKITVTAGAATGGGG